MRMFIISFSIRHFLHQLSLVVVFCLIIRLKASLAKSLKKGDPLFIVHDFQNQKDTLALSLRTDEPACLVGYISAYFA